MKTEVTLGIDIGGTNTKFGFVDRDGNFITASSILTLSHQGAGEFFTRLNPEIDSLYNTISENYVMKGIGIGAPNANYYRGTVENPPNLNWGVVNVVNILNHYFRVTAVITNDANASAIGEMIFGAAKGIKDFIVITLGTGLGTGVVVDGKLVYGSDGFAGELGHTVYDSNGRQCGCGKKGCLETYASATGIKRTVMELLSTSNGNSSLRDISYNDLESKTIYSAALAGDKIALEAFEYTGKVLGQKLADAVAITSPEAIILFGGLALAGDLILEPTKRYLEANMFHVFRNKVKLLLSGLPEGNSAVLGASALIWNELIKTNELSRVD